nr:MAG TPA: hypothetical protein [Caudoviricetes sp.]DAO99205.1 MAG TPA: hypothetical protein [Caudoviricetes sp.]
MKRSVTERKDINRRRNNRARVRSTLEVVNFIDFLF